MWDGLIIRCFFFLFFLNCKGITLMWLVRKHSTVREGGRKSLYVWAKKSASMGFQVTFVVSNWPHFGFLDLFNLRYFSGLTSWSMKAVKELYGKKTGGQDIFCIFTLLLGSTTIQWVRKLFSSPNEMGSSSWQGVKMCKFFLGISVQIWYLRR